ncbi:glycosyltransferase family 92 protein [Ostreiculturibacter nitratireducens]|uniref:glycosyltransferase family 92 protein n=1 Tax=Ostreiculturibacter nitratireducens TaxID=3075226 RepID=UPI0031B6368A
MLKKLLSRAKISKLGIRSPRPLPDRSGMAIAVIVKNEADYIGEWARFHLAGGARHFAVYDDASTDDTIAVLRATLPPERLTVIPWQQRLTDSRLGREIHNQVLAYAHAASNFGSAFRWMAFIDVDEFLVPARAGSYDEALAPLGDVPNVSLPWHMFGTSGHATPPEGGVVPNFLQRARDPMSDAPGLRAFKCLVDPCRLTALRVHSVETDGSSDTWNDRGEKSSLKDRDKPGFYSADAIQLNHYYTRSRQDLEAKISRGPNLMGKAGEYRRKVMRTVNSIESDTVEDRRALDFIERAGQS